MNNKRKMKKKWEAEIGKMEEQSQPYNYMKQNLCTAKEMVAKLETPHRMEETLCHVYI
jgi:hypothetical protein